MRISSPHTLSRDEHTRLIIALEEMKARGLSLPEVPDTLLRPSQLRWPLDPRGYFVSNEEKYIIQQSSRGNLLRVVPPTICFILVVVGERLPRGLKRHY
jgi:hypothetical protein